MTSPPLKQRADRAAALALLERLAAAGDVDAAAALAVLSRRATGADPTPWKPDLRRVERDHLLKEVRQERAAGNTKHAIGAVARRRSRDATEQATLERWLRRNL